MTESLQILAGSILGIVIVCVWGMIDDRVEKGAGANLAIVLLFASLYCGLTGNWIPWGAGSLALAVFVWFVTLINSIDWRLPHR